MSDLLTVLPVIGYIFGGLLAVGGVTGVVEYLTRPYSRSYADE